MTYSPTTWINNSTPALNAANLNKMETGIDEAHDAANITNTPSGNIAATDVQAAIDELETEKESVVTAHHARHETGGGDVIANAIAAGNSGLMSGADKTKLNGVEALADVTDVTNVTAAGALMETTYNANTLVVAVTDDTPVALGVGASEIVGRTAGGNIDSLTATETRTVLAVEENADVTDAVNVASTIHGVAAKTTPVDADEVGLIDSAAANVLKKLTWTNIKATLKTYLDTLYAGIGANSDITSMTGLTTPLATSYGGTGVTDTGYTDLYRKYCGKLYGWFAGGSISTSYGDLVDRITLRDDTTNAIDRCNISVGRRGLAGFTDNIYGWFGGGLHSGGYSNVVDRITLVDDTTNAIDRCNLTVARYNVAGFTNNDYGWFGGGLTATNSDVVDRITLSDDTTNAINRCNLSVARYDVGGFTDNIYGWFGGGSTGSNSDVVDRITLLNDTANAIDRCNLSTARVGVAGFTDNTHGWFGGGYAVAVSDIVDRITLSDDTTNAIDKCNLSTARYSLEGFTDNIYGWFGAGMITTESDVVDRITLSVDTINALDKCNLSVARRSVGGFTG